MAIEVRIPKEITEYKEKVLFGMSIRQLICFSSAMVLSVSSYLLLTQVLGLSMDVASYVIIFEAMPLLAIGFIKINGFTFEKHLALLIRHKTSQQVRLYKTELFAEESHTGDNSEKEGGKYAWIFEKEQTGNGKSIISKKERKADAAIKEYTIFTVTKANRKAKRKATLGKIKAARQEYRSAKRRAKKEAKAASRTKNSTTDGKI